jgi:phage tail sheath gpL-like
MSIGFNAIPPTLRVPFVAVEFDNTKAQQGPALLAYRALLIGQKTASGTATADTAVRVTSVEQVIPLAGRGSMLHRQALSWFAVNKSTELWIGVLSDNGAGVAATGTIAVTGTATASGTIVLYLGGERVTVGVTVGDVQNTIATNINAAINNALDLPVTSTVATNTVTVAFRHKGTVGNTYDMRHSFNSGEALPAGVTLVITQLASGTTNPTLTNLIASVTDIWFQIWAHPYVDATSLAALEGELLLRFGPLRMQDGIAITATSGSFSTLTTLGAGRNSQQSLIFAPPGASPLTPPWEMAAENAGLIAFYGAADPGRPFQTLALVRSLPTALTDQWSIDERNQFLGTGIATTKLNPTATGVQLERAITTYRTSASGASDTSYLDATTMLTLAYLRYSFRVLFQTKYPRHKLGDDDVVYAPGQPIITPKMGKGEAFGWFKQMQSLALVQNFDQFKRDLVVERNTVDRNRLDFLLPPTVINQLIVTGAQIQFRV